MVLLSTASPFRAMVACPTIDAKRSGSHPSFIQPLLQNNRGWRTMRMSTALFLNILPHATNYAVDVPSPRETVELLHLIILMALFSLSSAIVSSSQTLFKPVVGYLWKKGKARKMMICGGGGVGGGGGSSLTPTGSTTITAFTVHVLPSSYVQSPATAVK